jgi:hypothetical protein
LIGIIIAGIFGAIVWPMIAMVAFSRQDFAASIESFLRSIPPPAGDTIADLFMEGNRVVARLDAKRQKLANDIIQAIGSIATILESINNRVQSGISELGDKIGTATTMKDKALASANAVKERAVDAVSNPGEISLSSKFDKLSNKIKESVDRPASPESDQRPSSSKFKSLSEKVRGSLKPGSSSKFSGLTDKLRKSAPVGNGRHKRLSTRRHTSNKWMTTRRRKSEMR